MKKLVFLLSCVIGFSVSAKSKHNHREHSAHQHGAGTLGIAFEGASAKLDFKIPSESIIGFEYTPKTEKDKMIKKNQLEKLETKMTEMVVFDSSLNCKMTKEIVDVVSEAGATDGHATHSDTIAKFNISCDKSPVGTKIIFNIQKVFPKIKDLDVQVIAGDMQKSVEATKNGTSLELK